MNDYIYDIETYPNCFTLTVAHAASDARWVFEISDWKNESREIIEFLRDLKNHGARMVGFNNVGFDYPVLHTLVQMGQATAKALYDKAMAIIGSQDNNDRWVHMVKPSDCIVEQLDLYKIHHFDNRARSTSLKVLEFNMRMDNIEDLPFPVGTVLNKEQCEELKRYNGHDVDATALFYDETTPMIEFREDLSRKYNRSFMNHNDTKIGKDYFIMRLEQSGIPVYEYGAGGRQPRQTKRPQIYLGQAVLPWLRFREPEFQRIRDWMCEQVITETKGVFKDLTATVNGFEFVFGLGGIHGSVESEVLESDDENVIIDLDVTSYYPTLAIANRFYPAHLGEVFCDIYQDVFEQRKSFAKGTPENAMLKLALNGVYGDSNNRYSVFYDPLYTMSITLNGQLLLCLLAEHLMAIDGLKMIQVNTDGLTVRVPRCNVPRVEFVRQWWEYTTGLQLEEATYSRMFIRDVNNYIAEYAKGGVKRKGAYEYERDWSQNHSALVVPKVAEIVLLTGANIRDTILKHTEFMDFMLRAKIPRSSKLVLVDDDGVDHPLQNVTRYYISKKGGKLVKIMPPLPKKPDEWRRIGIESGWKVQPCNNMVQANTEIDYDYYVKEVEKLVLGLA